MSAEETGFGDMPNLVSIGGHLIPPLPPNELGAAIATDPETGEPMGIFKCAMCYFEKRGQIHYLELTRQPCHFC